MWCGVTCWWVGSGRPSPPGWQSRHVPDDAVISPLTPRRQAGVKSIREEPIPRSPLLRATTSCRRLRRWLVSSSGGNSFYLIINNNTSWLTNDLSVQKNIILPVWLYTLIKQQHLIWALIECMSFLTLKPSYKITHNSLAIFTPFVLSCFSNFGHRNWNAFRSNFALHDWLSQANVFQYWFFSFSHSVIPLSG